MQLGIEAIGFNELLVGTLFGYLAMMQNDDPVGPLNC